MSHLSMKLRVSAISAVLAFCVTMMMPAAAAAQTSQPAATSFIQGTTSNGGVLSGVLKITSFANQGNQLVANGLLNGTLTSHTGAVTQIVNQAVTLPVTSVSATCQVLNLVLGPLDLKLLGLHVHLNQVVLDITANPAGGLLGQLLCDLSGLLNGTNLNGLLDTLVSDLNTILGSLGL